MKAFATLFSAVLLGASAFAGPGTIPSFTTIDNPLDQLSPSYSTSTMRASSPAISVAVQPAIPTRAIPSRRPMRSSSPTICRLRCRLRRPGLPTTGTPSVSGPLPL